MRELETPHSSHKGYKPSFSFKQLSLVCRKQTPSTMTKILFVAFSHALTVGQIEDAKASLGIDRIIMLGEVEPTLQKEFSQVPAQATTDDIVLLASSVIGTALHHGATHLYVAGEPSVVIHASIMAHEAGLQVVQSTTERRSSETVQEDGTVVKTAVFAHVQWRDVF
jgi:hypothetical protein